MERYVQKRGHVLLLSTACRFSMITGSADSLLLLDRRDSRERQSFQALVAMELKLYLLPTNPNTDGKLSARLDHDKNKQRSSLPPVLLPSPVSIILEMLPNLKGIHQPLSHRTQEPKPKSTHSSPPKANRKKPLQMSTTDQ